MKIILVQFQIRVVSQLLPAHVLLISCPKLKKCFEIEVTIYLLFRITMLI